MFPQKVWEEWLIDQMGLLQLGGAWTRNGLATTSWISTKVKCKILHLDKIKPPHQERLGADQLEISVAENDLTWWTPNLPWASNVLLWKKKRSKALRAAWSRALLTDRGRWYFPCIHLDYWVLCWAPQYKWDIKRLEQVQQRTSKMRKWQE